MKQLRGMQPPWQCCPRRCRAVGGRGRPGRKVVVAGVAEDELPVVHHDRFPEAACDQNRGRNRTVGLETSVLMLLLLCPQK